MDRRMEILALSYNDLQISQNFTPRKRDIITIHDVSQASRTTVEHPGIYNIIDLKVNIVSTS